MIAEGHNDGKGNGEWMLTDAVGEHLGPRLALVVSVAKAEHNEGEPSEEKQAIEQWTTSKTACDAEQRTFGSRCCKQNGDEDCCIDCQIA